MLGQAGTDLGRILCTWHKDIFIIWRLKEFAGKLKLGVLTREFSEEHVKTTNSAYKSGFNKHSVSCP